MKNLRISVLGLIFIFGCNPSKVEQNRETDIVTTVLENDQSFYHVDFKGYPRKRKSLPIGVFDSGTGGLTVLKAIVNFDEFNNDDRSKGGDGILDFNKESFIYLGDQANMPYGNYAKEGKVDLLKEHIIKDAQFLLGNKYYPSGMEQEYAEDKEPVKAIVVACNTATAYGKDYIENFLSKAKSDIKVIGVIDAGVHGALESFEQEEDGIIGVLATAGTVASKGYSRTIVNFKKTLGYSGNIEVFQQGGVGIAEAVDEDTNYIIKGLESPRDDYKGPGLQGDLLIDKTLMEIYNFDFTDGKMLCDASKADDCSILQINDGMNYVRYHLVTLMEKIRKSSTTNQLKTIILGCTHYPYLIAEIKQVLEDLYDYQTPQGQFLYRQNMAEDIVLVDPAVNTARELFEHLNDKELFNPEGDINESEFYISVTNQDNPGIALDENKKFTYNYKYGRNANEIQEYVKVVPFSRNNISDGILKRFEKQMPFVYELMQKFNANSPRTSKLEQSKKI